jgi:pSer/pThr/pTyr-binding forkhead associated (FHA) protein
MAACDAVSERHARLFLDASGTIQIDDLRSTNGTRVDGNPIIPGRPVSVQPGQAIHIANIPVDLVVLDEEPL